MYVHVGAERRKQQWAAPQNGFARPPEPTLMRSSYQGGQQRPLLLSPAPLGAGAGAGAGAGCEVPWPGKLAVAEDWRLPHNLTTLSGSSQRSASPASAEAPRPPTPPGGKPGKLPIVVSLSEMLPPPGLKEPPPPPQAKMVAPLGLGSGAEAAKRQLPQARFKRPGRTDREDDRKGEEPGQQFESSDSATSDGKEGQQGQQGSTGLCRQGFADLLQDEVPTLSALLCPSVGSMGHPESCAEACKFHYRKKKCKDGRLCVRCHLCAWSRYANRKKNREEAKEEGQEQDSDDIDQPQTMDETAEGA